ncbi:MAG: tetratricopeptide repeat protein [Bacteroidota bacterium]
MKKFISFCVLIYCLSHPCWGDTIDSLQLALKQYTQKQNVEELVKVHSELGQAYKDRYEHELALEHFHQALQLVKILKFPKKQFDILNHIGVIYFWKDEYKQSLNYLLQARKLGISIIEQKKQAQNLSQIAQVYLHLNNHKQALFHQFQARDLSELAGDSVGMAQAYTSLGAIYLQTHRYPEGEKYLLQALSIYRKLDYPLNLWSVLATLSSAELEQKKLDEAFSYCTEAKSLAEKNDIHYGTAFSTGTLGLIFLRENQFDVAEHHLQNSLLLLRDLGVKAEAAEFSFGLAEVYAQRGSFQQALDTLQEILQIAQNIGSPRIAKEAYGEISRIYEMMGDLEQAYAYLQHHLRYRDSIETEAIIFQTMGAESEFEVHQQQVEASQAEKIRQQNQTQVYSWLLMGSLLALAVLGIVFIRMSRNAQEIVQTLSTDTSALQERHELLAGNHRGLSELIALTSQRIHQPFETIQAFIALKATDQEDWELQEKLNTIESWFADVSVYSALGQSPDQKQEVDLATTIGQAISQLPASLHPQATQIRVQDLPSIQAHPHHMSLLFRHLLQETIPAKGNKDTEIFIQSQAVDGAVQIDIHSNQATSADVIHEIGFGICHAIIGHHGGKLWKTYDPMSGSKISFTIPV